MKVVIIAGGKGTRIASLNSEIPKAMIPINGKPVLEYQIELAKRYGHTDIFLVIGYLGDKIRSYFGMENLLECRLNILRSILLWVLLVLWRN